MMDFRIVPHRVISSKNMIEVSLDGVVVSHDRNGRPR
jgi:hypothetical protein